MARLCCCLALGWSWTVVAHLGYAPILASTTKGRCQRVLVAATVRTEIIVAATGLPSRGGGWSGHTSLGRFQEEISLLDETIKNRVLPLACVSGL